MLQMLCKTFVLSCVIFSFTSGFGAKRSLRLVNLVFRHGDRSPVTTYPNNPNLVNITWPDGLGWLTDDGMRMHYSLGRFLRRSYDGFLSEEYDHDEIRVESSYVDRCLMSAYSNLAGLYPPHGDQVWNKNISWQPIPVYTRPQEEDTMLAMGKACPRYNQIYSESLTSSRIKKIENDNKAIIDFLSEKSGLQLNLDNMWKVSDTVFCEREHNISQPSWVNSSIFTEMRHLEALGFGNMYHNSEEQKLKGGPLLKEWIRLAQKKIDDKTYTNKMNMFSAHDTTVVVMLSALKSFNDLNPPYTSTVFMELHQNVSSDFYVELYLRNRTSQDPDDNIQPHQLTLPGCQFQCPLDQFIKLTKDVVPVDWDAECNIEGQTTATYVTLSPGHDDVTTGATQASTDNKDSVDYRRAFIITVAVYSVVVLLLIVLIMLVCFRRNRSSAGMI